MYSGFPSIRLEGDEARALALIPQAKALLYRVQEFKKTAGVTTYSLSRRIGDDATVYALSSGDQHILHIAVAIDVPEGVYNEDTPATEQRSISLYSGLVFGGTLETRGEAGVSVCASFTPTQRARQAHPELNGGRQEVSRLAVRPWAEFEELAGSGLPVLTQYARLRPSMYSGTMATVVQALMGVGRLPKAALTGLPKAYADAVEANGVQIRYDWRFLRTHLITFGEDGASWLVEISAARGVIAMPLPMFPGVVDGGNRDLEAVFDALGGLPSGGTFPTTPERLQAQIDAGTVLRLLQAGDLDRFYECSAYSTALGWAANTRGTEAHNTAYYYDETGYQRGVWYLINIQIGPVRPNREPGEPLAIASANLRLQREGAIYCYPGLNNSEARYVPIKFHEPLLGGLLSHEGVPTRAADLSRPPLSDTPMFVAFINGGLKVASYYHNPVEQRHEVVEDSRIPGECLVNGSWTITETTGNRRIPRSVYTNEFDDRRVLQDHTRITTITSVDQGYMPPQFEDFIPAFDHCYISRSKRFKSTIVTDSRGGDAYTTMVAVPQFCREAYYYATASRYNGGRSGSTGVTYRGIRDPNVAYGWRCFISIGPSPMPRNRPDCNTRVCRGDGTCSHITGKGVHRERRVMCLAHEPSECSEFADSGSWLNLCQIVDRFNDVPYRIPVQSQTTWNLGDDASASLRLITAGYNGPLAIPITAQAVFDQWASPSEPYLRGIQAITATYSALGAEAAVYLDDLVPTGKTRVNGLVPENVSPADGIPTFIGVNS